jgi:hypothetical protein
MVNAEQAKFIRNYRLKKNERKAFLGIDHFTTIH